MTFSSGKSMRSARRTPGETTEEKVQGHSPVAVGVDFRDGFMYVHLQDGRLVSVPITAYRRLCEATPEQRTAVEISPHGISLHWEDIDEDLSVSGLVRDFGASEAQFA
jgi:Protein of unknown function (DUF2442)